ncbi:hypothetical protein Tco_1149536 [Tanacetum coccineum]
MYRRQGYMIRDMERKCVTTDKFWKLHGKVDQRVVADTAIQERDAFQAEVPALISKEFDAQAPQIIEKLFKKYVPHNVIQVHPTTTTSTDTTSSADLQQQYSKMKRSLQDQANDPALWEVLKYDDAPPEGEKIVKRHKASKSSKFARGSSSKQSAKESTTYVTKQQQHQHQEWDAWEEETGIDKDEVIPEDETPELITEF